MTRLSSPTLNAIRIAATAAPRLGAFLLSLTLGLALASSVWAGKPNPADGTGGDSDHIPIQMTVVGAAPCPDGHICSDKDEPYIHEVDNVLCDLNSPGSVICNSSDSRKGGDSRKIWFAGPKLRARGILDPVLLRMTTTFCNVRDLGAGESVDCNLNFRIDLGGDVYSLRFDSSEGATSVTAQCTDSPLGLPEGDQCQTFVITAGTNGSAALYRVGRKELERIDTVPLQVELQIQILP